MPFSEDFHIGVDDLERLRTIAEDEDLPLRDRAACALAVACDGDPRQKVSFGEVADVLGVSPPLAAAALASILDDCEMGGPLRRDLSEEVE